MAMALGLGVCTVQSVRQVHDRAYFDALLLAQICFQGLQESLQMEFSMEFMYS
jgi:hypothetical protein